MNNDLSPIVMQTLAKEIDETFIKMFGQKIPFCISFCTEFGAGSFLANVHEKAALTLLTDASTTLSNVIAKKGF